jgi:hypothetical protein
MDALIRDLGATQEYLVAQRQVSDTTAAQNQQLQSWVGRLGSMSIQAADASRIVALIGQGPWSQEQRTELAGAVNTAVLNNGVSTGGSRRPLQICANFKAYLSHGDLKVLGQQDTPLVAKIDTVCTRMVRIGLHLPQENCLRLVMAVAQAHGLQVPDGNENKFTVFKELKRVLKSKVQRADKPAQHMVAFPHNPGELPAGILQAAYDENDPPCGLETDVNGMASYQQSIPLRLSNRLVKPGVNHANQLVPYHGAPPPSSGGEMNPFMQMMLAMQQQMVNMHQQQQNMGNGGLANLHIFRQATPQRRALTNGTENPATESTPQQNTTVEKNDQKAETTTTVDKSQPETTTADKSKADTTLAPAETSILRLQILRFKGKFVGKHRF